jgi:hypothetical protein
VGDAGVEPTTFGSGDTGKRHPQNPVNLWKLHQFPRHLKMFPKKIISPVSNFLHALSRNLTKSFDNVKE